VAKGTTKRLFKPWLERLEERQVPAVWLVTTGFALQDGLAGSLRWAINNVDNGNGGDTIDFAIGALGQVATIQLDPNQGALPVITQSVTIDGYSQGGQGAQTGVPWVQLDGTNLGTGGKLNGTGLLFDQQSGGSLVQGLAIYSFSGDGMDLTQANNAGITVRGCYIGNNVARNLVPAGGGSANGGDGIFCTSNNNTIGGTANNTGNWITNNGVSGVFLMALAPPGPTGNFIGRNTIGCDQTGRGGNAVDSVRLVRAPANLIGVNEIMGNSGDGVDLTLSANNQIYENYIGTDGQVPFGNGGDGIDLVSGSTGTTIDNNLISGNALDGIFADDTSSSTDIYANTIGLDAQYGIAIPKAGTASTYKASATPLAGRALVKETSSPGTRRMAPSSTP
jgi:parallel beta-helix repeat protein